MIRVIGCGRSHRQDDQFGLHVAARVADAVRLDPVLAQAVRVSTTEAPGADVLADLDGVRLLIIVDAAQPVEGFPPGHWQQMEYPPAPCPADRPALQPAPSVPSTRTNTHTLGLADALELGRTLGLLPADVRIFVAAGRDFGYGEDLSPDVAQAGAAVAEQICRELRNWLAQPRSVDA